MHGQQRNEESLLEQVLQFQSAAARAAFLEAACAGDQALRTRIESLIEAHAQAGLFLPEKPGHRVFASAAAEGGVGTDLGPYTLRERIGEGGYGVVFVADQLEPIRRRVALKVIKGEFQNSELLRRFEAERQALAMMDHPNIAKVLDAGATRTGQPYLVMELVHGIKITDYCDQNRLSTRERLQLFLQVCRAVQHAHQKSIIHRDLKPANVLVASHDGVAIAKVIDFGIAKAIEGRLSDATIHTRLNQVLGTPAYMSPEQVSLSGIDIDTRSDIYSLGVLLYELLTGKTPFDSKELLQAGLDAMRRIVCDKEPPRPSTCLGAMGPNELAAIASKRRADPPTLHQLVRGDLDWIVMKALEKDRVRRYETANGLAADVLRYLKQEPVLARPPSTIYNVQKLIRRNKLAFAAVAGIAMSLLLGIAATAWEAARVHRLGLEATAKDREARSLMYVAKLKLCQQEWDGNNVGRVRELLRETADYPDRGFEWFYWQRQAHLPLRTLRGGHSSPVMSMAFSPDGRRLASASWDYTAQIWDPEHGIKLFKLSGHTSGINALCFSPDGAQIATGSADRTVRIWDAASGHELHAFTCDDSIRAVAYSPDGRFIATGSKSTIIQFWNTSNGLPGLTLRGHNGPVSSVAFSPNSQRLVSASADVWDGSPDHRAIVWNLSTGSPVLTLVGHTNQVRSVVFSPDGTRIVTASEDHTARLWNAANGTTRSLLTGHSAAVSSAAFSPDGRRIVTGSEDQTARVWDAETGEPLFILKGHSSPIESVAFSPDGRKIATSSGNLLSTSEHNVRIWDATRDSEVFKLQCTNHVQCVRFSHDGRRIVTAGQTATVWDTASSAELFRIEGHTKSIEQAAFSPDGNCIATCSLDHRVDLWDGSNGAHLSTLLGHTGQVACVTFSPDGKSIATGSDDLSVKLWSTRSGSELKTLRGHQEVIWDAAFSPDGKHLATASNDKTVRIWDLAMGKSVHALQHGWLVYGVSFSPDGRRIASCSADQTVRIWNVNSGELQLTLNGHGDQVFGVAFSPDGRRVASCSIDGTARLWDTDTGQELLRLKGHTATVRSIAFSPDGLRIVTGGYDGTAILWRAATGAEAEAWAREDAVPELPGPELFIRR